jgi:hypothetical protein
MKSSHDAPTTAPTSRSESTECTKYIKDLRVNHVQTGSTKRALDSDQIKYRLCLVFQFLPRPGLSSVVHQGKIAQDCNYSFL